MSDRTPADVLADWWFATDYCSQPEPFTVPVSESILAALAAAGYRVTPEPDDDTRAEVRDRVSEMRLIAELIDAKPDGMADEEDARQWRRDADLLAAAYLDGQPQDRPATCPTCGPQARVRGGMHVQKPPPDPRFCSDPWHIEENRSDGCPDDSHPGAQRLLDGV